MSKRLHVVLVSRIYAPEPAAASFRLEAMVNGLAGAGHDVTVLTTQPRPGSAPPVDAGKTVTDAGAPLGRGRVDVRAAPVLRNREGYVRGYVQYLSFDLPAALRLLVVRKPDVVVVEPPPTTGVVVRVVAALRRVPYVYYAADLWSDAVVSDSGRGLVARVLARVEGWAMRGARGVIAVLPAVADRVRELTGDREARPLDVRVVGHGIDTEVFRPAEPGDLAPEGAPSRYLVYTGTTSSWHGADIFIRALALAKQQAPDLDDLELVYLGHGSQWAELQDLARELAPGAVHFHPMAPPEQAAAWLRAAAAAVVSLKPGQNYDLAFPTKLYAAVACGTPVVFAGVGPAIAPVRDHGLGIATEYDADSVASGIIALAREARLPLSERAISPGHLAGWVGANASLERAGAQAAAYVEHWASR